MTKPTHRKTWMFPRNVRRITPWKMVQITMLMDTASGNTSDQSYQDQLYWRLANLNVKQPSTPYLTSNSGGMRTYYSQQVCLGLLWQDHSSKKWETTRAGECLIKSKKPIDILQCQLLRMQYPSVYGLGSQVRISPELNVKPFVFLVRLLMDPRLEGRMTELEFAIPVVYGRTPQDHDKCIEKILALRKGEELKDQIDSIDDLRTPKRYRPDDPDEDWRTGLQDIQEIGNTAKNYMLGAHMISASSAKKTYELSIDPINDKKLQSWMQEPIEPYPDNKEAWQLRFGRYDKTKVVKHKPNTSKKNGLKTLISTNLINSVSDTFFNFSFTDFVEQEAERWGKSPAEVASLIEHLRDKTSSISRDAIMDAAFSGGKEALTMEKGVASIFKELGFDETEHIGQKTPANRRGGYPDIRIAKSGSNSCAFGDTKATGRYSFPITDTEKLNTYYKECWKEFKDNKPSQFFCYIAGGFAQQIPTVQKKLKEIEKLHGRPVSAVTLRALLDLLELKEKGKPLTPEQISNALSKSDIYTSGACFKLFQK